MASDPRPLDSSHWEDTDGRTDTPAAQLDRIYSEHVDAWAKAHAAARPEKFGPAEPVDNRKLAESWFERLDKHLPWTGPSEPWEASRFLAMDRLRRTMFYGVEPLPSPLREHQPGGRKRTMPNSMVVPRKGTGKKTHVPERTKKVEEEDVDWLL